MSGVPPSSTRFDDGKAPDAMRTIGEVSAAFHIKPHVLRYWEQQFPMLRPLKRSGGRRLYRAEDISLIERINQLVKQQGYTLKGAKKALQEGGRTGGGSTTASEAESPRQTLFERDENRSEALAGLQSIRDRLASALAE
ncbi:MerR family transcriptional regulator [Aurantiacibacter odishensis]|uniref:MerR family transcriptional regulator n=1 Tax=Aurantiacibacter odishensis TaxID=1155476 RepID=UPI000E716372|nr:MerR family transcriptional regulator [Aurantiacibacter odishensis]